MVCTDNIETADNLLLYHWVVGSHPTRISSTSAGTDIFIRSVDCDGNEGRLLECSMHTDDHCNNADVAGVRCEGKSTLFSTLRNNCHIASFSSTL